VRLPRAIRSELARLVDEAEACLDDDDVDRARTLTARVIALAPDHPDTLLLQADIALAEEDLERARDHLEQAARLQPNDADVHDRLARIHEHRGDQRAMIHHALRVLALDARSDRRRAIGTPHQLEFIEGEVRRVLMSLPHDLADRVAEVPIVLEPRPSFALVREGFDPRALGLFEGSTDDHRYSSEPAPRLTRIVLFFANLLAITSDDETLAEQVEITVLHEIGHFFGLDEAEVEALGLA